MSSYFVDVEFLICGNLFERGSDLSTKVAGSFRYPESTLHGEQSHIFRHARFFSRHNQAAV